MIFGSKALIAQYEARIGDLKAQIEDLRAEVTSLRDQLRPVREMPLTHLEADAVLNGREEIMDVLTPEQRREALEAEAEAARILSAEY